MNSKKTKHINSKSPKSFHNILDIDLFRVAITAIGLTVIVYGVCLLFINSYLGELLYKRGFTQYLTILLASVVAVFTWFKFNKINSEWNKLSKNLIPEHINFDNYDSFELVDLQKSLSQGKSFISIRCGRVLAAYISSGNRTTVAEFIADDSSFYTAASASSYVLPRILIWAIPLMGFIGTVMGISSAVTGFSSFLSGAEEIEQIKEGIGLVTSGLAIAFDTTLLALLLSVLVMLPLVAIERFESQLLLAVDIYLNDQLLTKIKDKAQNSVESLAINRTQKFVEEASKIQTANTQLLEQIDLTTNVLEKRVAIVTQLQQGLNISSELGTSSQLDKVLERVSDNLAQLEPVLKELNLPRRLVLVEEKNQNNKL
ncbi:MotA/TolQ/ExbB proton channel family protein [Pleurocapsa sp. FMAR1]|uniref:MotA/TolQ/ExbB proton channel family protein n=1 Tax=Pleurocapsa sp. FMAR1 TaxID=3040204 RepID=UPI0029C7DD51|nr:MotA/TolQ/ExbB proton channel family protein [Pleurocapsa sp. FMAR1]